MGREVVYLSRADVERVAASHAGYHFGRRGPPDLRTGIGERCREPAPTLRIVMCHRRSVVYGERAAEPRWGR